jgi:hypothetical protein
MFTIQDDDHEQLATPSELDPLIQRDEKGPSKKEKRVARAQFLALCLALFVVGWTDGSTGPLLPRIQIFYDVSWAGPYPFDLFFLLTSHEFCRWDSEQCLGYSFCNVRSVLFCWVVISCRDVDIMPCSGIDSGCIAQHAIKRQTRSRQGESY